MKNLLLILAAFLTLGCYNKSIFAGKTLPPPAVSAMNAIIREKKVLNDMFARSRQQIPDELNQRIIHMSFIIDENLTTNLPMDIENAQDYISRAERALADLREIKENIEKGIYQPYPYRHQVPITHLSTDKLNQRELIQKQSSQLERAAIILNIQILDDKELDEKKKVKIQNLLQEATDISHRIATSQLNNIQDIRDRRLIQEAKRKLEEATELMRSR